MTTPGNLKALRERVDRDAVISDCGAYRYTLGRWWGPMQGGDSNLKCIFVMLNPSTADASIDDPTIRRCISFAKREGFGGLTVLNLFALRATDPAELKRCADPVGPKNDEYLTNALHGTHLTGSKIIAAWGVHGELQGRALAVKRMARKIGVPLYCLGTTKDGHPKHPLYLSADSPLRAWSNNPMPEAKAALEAALGFDPFAGDFGDPSGKLFSDKIVTAAKAHAAACNVCGGDIAKGEIHRARRELFDGEIAMFRFCQLCCLAMIADDNGDTYEKRTAMHPSFSTMKVDHA